MHQVVVIGDAFVDIMASVDRLPRWGGDTESKDVRQMAGGSALNVAVQLGEMLKTHGEGAGVGAACGKCSFFGLVGDDDFGTVLRRRLVDAQVEDCMLTPEGGAGTGVCIVLSGSEDRAFVTQVGATGQLATSHLSRVLSILYSDETTSLSVHVSGFYSCASLRPELAEFLKRVRGEAHRLHKAVTVSLDTNCDASEQWDGGVVPCLNETDIFLPNEGEARGISGEDNLEKACDKLAGHVRGCCVVTCGGEGCLFQTREGRERGEGVKKVSAPRDISPLDATGAGDAFDAGFLFRHGVCGAGLEDSVKWASCAGALCTQSFGANGVPITVPGVESLFSANF